MEPSIIYKHKIKTMF